MKRYIATLLILIVFISGCGRDENSSASRTSGVKSSQRDSAIHPNSEVRGARIYLYDKGVVTAEIVAEKLLQFDSQDSTMAYQLDINVLDSLGQVTSEVTGDSGIIRENSGQFNIFGNVVVISENGSKLETDYLYWDSKTDRIHTDAFVRITTDDEIVTGWGMEADQRMHSYKILNRISGSTRSAGKFTKP